jgi:mono/diheme cytochrome c family protein
MQPMALAMNGLSLLIAGWVVARPVASVCLQAGVEPQARVGVQTSGQAGGAAEGVYTDEQADRGREAYRKHCVRCHLADLGGDQLAPPLVGEAFLSHWKGGTVGALFVKIKESMPPDAPGEPSDAEYAAIITYLLKMNRFPSGQKELTSDVTLLNGIAFPNPLVGQP